MGEKNFYYFIFIVILFVAQFNCASGELIPSEYNTGTEYYSAVAEGETRSEAFNKAHNSILAEISAMVVSDISSRTSLITTEKEEYFRQRIKNSTDITLMNIKPIYKDYKKVNGKMKCGLVIYFPEARIEQESEKIINKQRKIVREVELLFKHAKQKFEEGKINRAITILSSAESKIEDLIFEREAYFSRIVSLITEILGSLSISKNVTPDKFLVVDVYAFLDNCEQPVSSEKFILKTWRDTEVIEETKETDRKGSFRFNLEKLRNCEDTLYIYPAAVEGISYDLYEAVIRRLSNKNIFTVVWNVWEEAVVEISTVKIKSIEWYKKRNFLYYKYLPSKMRFNFEIEKESDNDVFLSTLYVEVIRDVEGMKDILKKMRIDLERDIVIEDENKKAFSWWASRELMDVVRNFYEDGFINLIFIFQISGEDIEGKKFSTNKYRLIQSMSEIDRFKR